MYKKNSRIGRFGRRIMRKECGRKRRNPRCIGLYCGASLVDVKGRYSGRWGALPGLSRVGDMLSGITFERVTAMLRQDFGGLMEPLQSEFCPPSDSLLILLSTYQDYG